MVVITFEVGIPTTSLTERRGFVIATIPAAPPLMLVVALGADAMPAIAAMLQFVEIIPILEVPTVMTESPVAQRVLFPQVPAHFHFQ